jgi:hypothetical protein
VTSGPVGGSSTAPPLRAASITDMLINPTSGAFAVQGGRAISFDREIGLCFLWVWSDRQYQRARELPDRDLCEGLEAIARLAQDFGMRVRPEALEQLWNDAAARTGWRGGLRRILGVATVR